MIAYEFVAPVQQSLDDLQAEIIVLPYFADERPLRGAAGLIDWRLCGELSRRLMRGELTGSFGEKGLLLAPPKLRSERLLLLGLGRSDAFDAGMAEAACSIIAEALVDAKLSTAALALPGRSMGRVSADEAMRHWLHACEGDLGLDELSIIEHPEEHRPLESVIDGLRRQAESPLG